ncbi:DctP family TRAP transporter solute-binding subunit [Alkalihalobacillus sp. 1P02AB]|uniref:DctP family TRAP transporter solute-binding subunit n=1 Tax=Alkalihalobacillus sp. 1P02AB TaxID=3132260 RepID=UPI0039A54FFE
MKKIVVFFTLSLVVFLFGCGDTNASTSDEEVTLRLGHIATETNPYHLLALEFKDLVEERTDGKVKIEIFPNAQLGEERELIEAMTFGNLDMAVITTPPVSNFVTEFGVLDIPYLFEDWDHVDKFLDSDIANDLLNETEKIGITTYAFIPRGFRSVTNSIRPVYSPEDMKGLTIRVIESAAYLDTINEMGATATGMNWGDTFTAMQQGAIDGQENDYTINYTQNVFEVQKYLSLTEHIIAINTLMGSDININKLSDEIQEIIRESAIDAAEKIRVHNYAELENLEALLIEKGMEINEVDKESFMNSVQNTQNKYSEKFGEQYFQRIKDLN